MHGQNHIKSTFSLSFKTSELWYQTSVVLC